MPVEFDGFTLDRGARQLRQGTELRHLSPKAFDLLDLLLCHRPNVLDKRRLRARLWLGAHVSDSTLATVVAEVRSALGDDHRKPRWVRTVHGVGYAFCGDARDSGPRSAPAQGPVAFRLLLEDREVALQPGENLLGRVDEGVAWIEAATVSRRHARILVDEDQAVIEDLGSKNGTFVRGERILCATRLAHGDVIRLGRVSMRFRALRADLSTASEAE